MCTHGAGPHAECVGPRLHFVEPVDVIQAASVLLCLAIFVGETLHRLDVGESLCGHLVGFTECTVEFYRNALKHRMDIEISDLGSEQIG